MKSDKLEALIESLNLTEEKAQMIRTVLREMLSHQKTNPETLTPKDAKLILMAQMVEETDWRKRSALAAGIISLNL